MQLDTHYTLGNVATVAVTIFFVGGAWASIHFQLRSLKESHDASRESTKERFDEIDRNMKEIRDSYVAKNVDLANENLIDLRIKTLEGKLEALERKRR